MCLRLTSKSEQKEFELIISVTFKMNFLTELIHLDQLSGFIYLPLRFTLKYFSYKSLDKSKSNYF